ncbi:hypothetical protein GW932_04575 [archaeon]|nr:hypothetical protein [archaeon]
MMVKKKRRILEITTFKIKQKLNEEEFKKISDKFHKFIEKQIGFEHRMILIENNKWYEIIQWRNIDFAKDASKKAKKENECKEYFEAIIPKTAHSIYPELVKMY